jgi:ubiquinone/menaquinone biosynthesis C-methylase UbiE
MVVRVDPERNELRALKEAATWRGKNVLEVGCGEGRLTLRLATLGPRRIQAIDPNADRIRVARQKLPSRFAEVIRYAVGSASELKHPAQTFDIMVFSWVL